MEELIKKINGTEILKDGYNSFVRINGEIVETIYGRDEQELENNIKHLMYKYNMNTEDSDRELISEIEAKIKQACTESKYVHLCQRVESEGGMINVINRCIKMMSEDGIHLSAALAALESEFEGVE